jgi:pimeloyl-ACP methyl ester carboxylesterase
LAAKNGMKVRLHPVTRPDGVQLNVEERGEGPLVVLAVQFFGFPLVFEDLITDLAQDHRVVTYDIRGCGGSTRQGPYDMATDAEDLGAVVEKAGPPALVIGAGDGVNRAVRLAASRPELVTAVVTPGGNPVGRLAAEGTDALVDSPSVLEALVGMMETDFRGALRTMVASANPQMSEEEARDRVAQVVAYCPQEAGVPRLRAWIDDSLLAEARALADRLWMLILKGTNPWFPAETTARTRELLPEARLEKVEDGPISRPDLTAAVIRRITAARGAIEPSASARGAVGLDR